MPTKEGLKKFLLGWACVTTLLIFPSIPPVLAKPLSPEGVPEPLKPWIPWVLHGKESQRCPFVYNQGAQHRCAWPSQLEVTVTPKGGTFRQRWLTVLEGYVPLPGDSTHWPQDVKRNQTPLLVTEKNGAPRVFLPAGSHTIRGSFTWERLPEFLRVPGETGLVSLSINTRSIRFPKLDARGRLWIQKQEMGSLRNAGVKNTLDMQVFRKVVDEIPLQVTTRLKLDIGGDYREVVLGKILFPDYIPLSLQSPLPARLEPDGRLRLQVRPGQWIIHFTARHRGPTTILTLDPPGDPWPKEEIWIFDARPHLRLVEIEGVPTIDPQRTNLPEEWKSFPAYRLHPGDRLKLQVKRRGDPVPNPDRLWLNRTLWLDFENKGYTIQDQISGTITQTWRLEINEPIALGQVRVDGTPQFITRLSDSQREGVEVRRGTINVTADSRVEGSMFHIPAVGWNHDIHNLQATLNLPPGWELLGAKGVDHVPGTWLARWTLLDLFLVLITALAVSHLWSWHWGLLALVTLTLTYHEPGAPRWMWLHLLAATTLLRVLPTGKFQQAAGFYRLASLGILLVILFPFAVHQVRVGLFPQLEKPWQVVSAPPGVGGGMQFEKKGELGEEQPAEPSRGRIQSFNERAELKSPSSARGTFDFYDERSVSRRVDPKAKIQTGPGLPTWTWNKVFLRWSGPVKKDETITLILLSPTTNLFLHVLQVILVAALLFRLSDWTAPFRPQGPGHGPRWLGTLWKPTGTTAVLVTLLISGTLLVHQPQAWADIPSESVLKELETRLLEKPECLPACAQIPRLHLTATATTLRLRVQVHAQQHVAVPLPGQAAHWIPNRILLNGARASGLFRDSSGTLWINLPKGSHHVQLEGPLPKRTTIQLPLPLHPRHTTVEATAWKVHGLHENGSTDPQIQLTRIKRQRDQDRTAALEPTTLPPFVRIERTLLLDVDWRVLTRLTRVSPPGTAIVLEVPLIPGESVTTDGVRVRHDKVFLSLSPGQSEARWTSLFQPSDKLTLTAPETTAWTEVWRLNISPIWHPHLEGIPVIHHSNPAGHHLPEWRPWPGEQATVSITRPTGVEGPTLTIDRSHLLLKPGRRATDATLTTTLRSSQGGQHLLTLPESAQLESVTVNGASQPIRLDGRALSLPIKPGTQKVQVSWREPTGVSAWYETAPIDLGVPSVNTHIELQLPRDRWPLLTGGPGLGPAVLFWGLLLMIILFAAGLGQIRLTPLRTWQWGLLGVGLSQVPVWMALVIVAWFLALGARQQLSLDRTTKTTFNLIQIGLGILTVVAVSFLIMAINQGLLGAPAMQIAGNGSSTYFLRWYQDQSEAILPQAWVISTPLLVYRFLMLAWSLWLAIASLGWIRWAWSCFSAGGYWRTIKPKVAQPGQAQPQGESS